MSLSSCISRINKTTISELSNALKLRGKNRIAGVMVSVFAMITVDNGLELLIKPNNVKLICIATTWF